MGFFCIEKDANGERIEIKVSDGGFYAIMHPGRQQLFPVSKATMDKIDEDMRRDATLKLDFDVDVYEGEASETPNGSYTFGSFTWGDYLFSIPRAYAEKMFPKLFELT